jgi:hypothetical protein
MACMVIELVLVNGHSQGYGLRAQARAARHDSGSMAASLHVESRAMHNLLEQHTAIIYLKQTK